MSRLLRIVIVLLIADSTMVNFSVIACSMSTVAKSFVNHGIVPNIVPKAPAGHITVKYPSGVEVKEGNELTPTSVKDVPQVSWDASPDQFYTLIMTDPDVPSRKDPKVQQWHHWLVGNVPGDQISAGETLYAYIGSGPPAGTGLHRYIFLVYKQPGKLQFDEPRLPNNSIDPHRNYLSLVELAEKYKLGDPIAGNFYQAQYDDYVPQLYKQLGA